MPEQQRQKRRFAEIEVERIHIVGEDGRVQMVISNKERLPDPVVGGKVLKRSGIPTPGLLFYNDEGDECGGLIFGGGRQDQEGKRKVGAGLFFDQYKQDQIVGLHYQEEDGQRLYGLQIWDRPDTPLPKMREAEAEEWGATRIFVGRAPSGEAVIRLSDRKGRERLRIVGDDGPRLEFLNEQGEVVYRLPPEG
jgi:hypothetical protein